MDSKYEYIKVLFYLGFLNFIYCFNSIPSYIYDQTCCGVSPYGAPLYYPFTLNSESDPFMSGQKIFGLNLPPPFVNPDDGSQKAYSCSQLLCFEDTMSPVCACNFNTGNVVTFKNKCDVDKHNCRFDTAFKVILPEICPWEFQSRRNNNNDLEIDYSDPKYYNDK